MKQSVTRIGGASALCSYELQHRVYSTAIYPRKAPNGSTIIIYGHDTGVRILWRGGRRPRQPVSRQESQKAAAPKVNGTAKNAVILVDSDDEEATPQQDGGTHDTPTDFESEDEELHDDNQHPYIIRHIDIVTNAEVLHITTPHISASDLKGTSNKTPNVLKKRMICAIACGDGSLQVVSLPLNPPSQSRGPSQASAKGLGQWREEVRAITSHHGHRHCAGDIAMAFTPSSVNTDDTEKMDLDASRADQEDVSKWELLLASTSIDPVGNLRVHKIPLASEGSDGAFASNPPYQQQYKTLPFTPTAVSFSPNTYPNSRHSELLVVSSQGLIKVYDPMAAPRDSRRLARLEEDGADVFPFKGTWKGSFSTEFEHDKQTNPAVPSTAHRKSILDAKWATGGRSVVALLSDGEWGLWDIEGSGPTGTGTPKSKTSQGTRFALRGYLGVASKSSSAADKARPSRSLAPMTPNTRRVKEDSLFHPTTPSQSIVRGSISVATLASASGGSPEDTILIRYGTEVHRLGNLAQYWSRIGSGSTGSLYNSGITKVEGIDIGGEIMTGVTQFPLTRAEARTAVGRDILVAAEHRIVIVSHSTRESQARNRLLAEEDRVQQDRAAAREMELDQTLLARGELDLNGMDRLLDNMAGSSRALAPSSRRVGFASS